MKRMNERALENSISRALLTKELRESRAALIAGAFIFLGLPLIWNLIFAAIDPKHESCPGLATNLLCLVGWIFCAVLAAQMVCRDFGRPQGDFLLARPITPAQVMQAKGLVGCGIVLGLVACVFALDWILTLFDPIHSQVTFPWIVLVIGTAVCLGTFWLTFAAATITRNTLSGVLLAVLVLVILVVLPLVTSSLAGGVIHGANAIEAVMTSSICRLEEWFPGLNNHQADWAATRGALRNSDLTEETRVRLIQWYPPYFLIFIASLSTTVLLVGILWLLCYLRIKKARTGATRSNRLHWSAGAFAWFLLIVLFRGFEMQDATLPLVYAMLVAVWLIARAVSLRAARSERAVRIGTKSIAWTVGLTMILIFTLAMREVGANLPVTATYWREYALTIPPISFVNLPRVDAAVGRARIAIRSNWNRVSLFDVNEDRITKRFELPVESMGDQDAKYLTERALPVFDDDDQLWLISVWQSMRRVIKQSENGFSEHMEYQFDLPRSLRLQPVDWETQTLGEPIELPRPTALPADERTWTLYDVALSGDRLYVAFLVGNNPSYLGLPCLDTSQWYMTATYRVDGGAQATLECVAGNRGYSWNDNWSHLGRGLDGRVYFLSPQYPPIDPSKTHADATYVSALVDFGDEIAAQLPISADRFACSSAGGLYVMGKITPPNGETPTPAESADHTAEPYRPIPRFEIIGAERASPWAWAFRIGKPRLLVAGDNLVWEVFEVDSSVVHADPDDAYRQGCVNCYDLSDPLRPRRIAHVTTFPIREAYVGPDFLLLDHGPGFSIVRNPGRK